jgi:hypothetical protein
MLVVGSLINRESQVTTLKFETEICSRCGGSGRHSYCEMHGDTCFKCHGKGQALTHRAVVASQWMAEQRKILIRDVKPGMVIKCCGSTYNVQSISQDTVSTSKSLIDGVMVESAPSWHINGIKHALIAQGDHVVELIPSKAAQVEQLRAAIEYQNTLTKAGTPRKSARSVEQLQAA